MHQIRLLSGVPIQIPIPKGIERTKKGAIYLQIGNPIQINDDEANYIKTLLENQLKNFRIILEPLIEKPKKNKKTLKLSYGERELPKKDSVRKKRVKRKKI